MRFTRFFGLLLIEHAQYNFREELELATYPFLRPWNPRTSETTLSRNQLLTSWPSKILLVSLAVNTLNVHSRPLKLDIMMTKSDIERQLQKLESTTENTSEDLTELSRKVTSNQYAIESLEHDLRRDIDNKIIDHAQRLTRAESDIEYLRLQVAELIYKEN